MGEQGGVGSYDRWAAEYLGVRDRITGGRSGAERTRRWRARKRGELPPFPFLAADLAANGEWTPEGCLVWLRSRNSAGYGHVKRDGRMIFVHRLSLEQKLGRSLGPRMVARHTCDTPPCFNPDHLIEGTYAENVEDMASRGRGWWQRR